MRSASWRELPLGELSDAEQEKAVAVLAVREERHAAIKRNLRTIKSGRPCLFGLSSTQAERARASGISRRSQQKLDDLARYAPDLFAKILSGERRVDSVWREWRARRDADAIATATALLEHEAFLESFANEGQQDAESAPSRRTLGGPL
jgi:hypothetical protein